MPPAQYLILSAHERYDGGDRMQQNFAQAYLEEFELQPDLRTRQSRSRTHLLLGHQTFDVVVIGVTVLAALSLVGHIPRAFKCLHDR